MPLQVPPGAEAQITAGLCASMLLEVAAFMLTRGALVYATGGGGGISWETTTKERRK